MMSTFALLLGVVDDLRNPISTVGVGLVLAGIGWAMHHRPPPT